MKSPLFVKVCNHPVLYKVTDKKGNPGGTVSSVKLL
jgi:hypothetical protein